MDIFTMINWLSIISSDYHELMLISKLNNFFNFDHNLFLLDSNADIGRFVNTNRALASTPQSVHVFQQRHDNNITGLDNIKQIDGKNVFLVIASERNTFQSNIHLLIEIKKIQRLKINMKIGIFFPLYQSNDDIRTFFEWCSAEKLIHIFAAFYLHPKEYGDERFLHIFTYNPFGTIDVTNVTGSLEFGKFFLKKNFNFRQHKLTFFSKIVPHTDIWPLILSILNVTTVVCGDKYPNNNCSCDICGYDFSESRHAVGLYPTADPSFELVIPKASPYKGFTGVFLAVSPDNIFIVTFITTIATILFLCMVRHKDKKRNSFFGTVADVLNLLMNDNDRIIYQNLSRIEVFVIVPLTFAGFIVVNTIISAFQSHLTRPFVQPQTNSIEGVYRSPLPIFTFSNTIAEQTIEILEKISPHGDWNVKVQVTNNATVLLGRIAMYDTSISFVQSRPFVNSLLKVQKMFNIQGYHINPITVLKRIPTYVLDENFVLSDRINEVIHWITSTGFLRNGQNGKFFVTFLKQNQSIPLPEKKFLVPMAMALALGWITSIIVFLMEIIWKKFNVSTETSKNVC